MKLNVILFALVCLGLLSLALAHDGESPPRSSTNTLPHPNQLCADLFSAGQDLGGKKDDDKQKDWDWNDWKDDDKDDHDCNNDDDDEKEEGKCFWKCVKVCHKKKPHHHTSSTTTKKHCTTRTEDCPRETTTTTKDCPKHTTSTTTTRKHRTTTPDEKDCHKSTSTTTTKRHHDKPCDQ
jgi:hypothetical protein